MQEEKKFVDNNMYLNYTPRFLWAGVSKHDEDGSLNNAQKTMRSSEPFVKLLLKKKKDCRIDNFIILSGFSFFHIQ